MSTADADTTPPPASRSSAIVSVSPSRAWLGLTLFAAAAIYFLVFFEEPRFQPTVDLAWLVASLAWCATFWRAETPSRPRLKHPLWFYALYAAVLIPFSTNWRWAMTGDTLSYGFAGLVIDENGPGRSILSVNGPDQFTYFQAVLDHVFLYIFPNTMFWDRLGKITVAVLTMAAVFTVFARLVSRPFGLLVAACSASCSVWIVYTYGSFPFLNGVASGYALLAIGLWVRRDPDSQRAWLTLGAFSGLMLFLTPNGWFMAICVWPWLGLVVLFSRRGFSLLSLAVVTAIIVGWPMLWQWSHGTGGQLFSLVENPGWTADKVARFFMEAAFIPFSSQIDNSGAFGPQLPEGFRWLFVLGILVTPLFPKRFPGARFILWIYVVHLIILTLGQGPYQGVSVKRALIIIPMATYYVFLPFHAFVSWKTIFPVIAVWASLGLHDILYEIKPGRTGYTLLDGVMEASQRIPDGTICVHVDDGRGDAIERGSPLDKMYGLWPHVRRVTEPDDPACSEVLCYCSQQQCEQIDLAARGYVEVPMMNTVELRCGRKIPPPAEGSAEAGK